MKYLPILDELFSSDLLYILFIGIVAAIIFTLRNRNRKKSLKGILVTFVAYIVCEILSNVIHNFLISIILLFIGCFSLGFAVCSMVSYFIVSMKKN